MDFSDYKALRDDLSQSFSDVTDAGLHFLITTETEQQQAALAHVLSTYIDEQQRSLFGNPAESDKLPSAHLSELHGCCVELVVYDVATARKMLSDLAPTIKEIRDSRYDFDQIPREKPPSWISRLGTSTNDLGPPGR